MNMNSGPPNGTAAAGMGNNANSYLSLNSLATANSAANHHNNIPQMMLKQAQDRQLMAENAYLRQLTSQQEAVIKHQHLLTGLMKDSILQFSHLKDILLLVLANKDGFDVNGVVDEHLETLDKLLRSNPKCFDFIPQENRNLKRLDEVELDVEEIDLTQELALVQDLNREEEQEARIENASPKKPELASGDDKQNEEANGEKNIENGHDHHAEGKTVEPNTQQTTETIASPTQEPNATPQPPKLIIRTTRLVPLSKKVFLPRIKNEISDEEDEEDDEQQSKDEVPSTSPQEEEEDTNDELNVALNNVGSGKTNSSMVSTIRSKSLPAEKRRASTRLASQKEEPKEDSKTNKKRKISDSELEPEKKSLPPVKKKTRKENDVTLKSMPTSGQSSSLVKRGRGRPRKYPLDKSARAKTPKVSTPDSSSTPITPRPKLKPGPKPKTKPAGVVPTAKSAKGANSQAKATAHVPHIIHKLNCIVKSCSRSFKNHELLDGHLLKDHKLKRYRCVCAVGTGAKRQACMVSFDSLEELRTHFQEAHGNDFTCGHCGKAHMNRPDLYLHYRLYHLDGHFQCGQCEFETKLALIKVRHHSQATHYRRVSI